MLKFFYDSLDTLKTVKLPTKKEMMTLTGVIVVLLIVSGLYFIGVDTVFSRLYQAFFDMMA